MKFFENMKLYLAAIAILIGLASPAFSQGFIIPDGSTIQGHIKAAPQPGPPPVAVGCTLVAGSTDFAGTCTASAASGSITFSRTYGSAPTCIVWDQAATSTVSMPVYSVSPTAITLITIISTHLLGYMCMGQASSS